VLDDPDDRDVRLQPRRVGRRLQVRRRADQLRVARDDERPGETLDVALARVVGPLDEAALAQALRYLLVREHLAILPDRLVSVKRGQYTWRRGGAARRDRSPREGVAAAWTGGGHGCRRRPGVEGAPGARPAGRDPRAGAAHPNGLPPDRDEGHAPHDAAER